ncbi:hypothetical protein P9E34_14195 [Schinkia azotoformans]|uniref:hypothetical protein n=1 Tax=Schinkia azotoformans TaxID=1454 RepID=UPI002DB6D1EE|nr:hypothetical protein [Schinkia azotoformans]MEC1725865.1 hypothetical protein [Schinkia azotoformans]
MMITFQIILLLIIVLFLLASLVEADKEKNVQHVSVLIAGIMAFCFSLWVG